MGGCLDITIAIDDIHPETGWGLPGDECMMYLDDLNREFGAKFTLFTFHYQNIKIGLIGYYQKDILN
jgi:hypothetical protein